MAEQKTIPLLFLSIDTATRHVIDIDGTNYTLRRSDDMTIDGSNRLGGKLRSLGDLHRLRQTSGRLNKASTQLLDRLLKEICEIVLDAPPRIHRKLTPVMRHRIINVFQALSLTSLRPAIATVLSGSPSALSKAIDTELGGKTSSPNSAGSTAGRRSRGGRGTR